MNPTPGNFFTFSFDGQETFFYGMKKGKEWVDGVWWLAHTAMRTVKWLRSRGSQRD
jgi:hypothetical protein